MAIKLVISGESNSGKTTLTKDVKDTLVISHDGKKYPFAVPHGTITTFDSAADLIAFVETKAAAYNDKFKEMPKVVLFDSVSRIYETLYASCSKKYTGFAVYTQLDKEIKEFADFVENTLVANGIDVVILSHAIYDADTAKYNLVGKGSFSKVGGFLSVVDEAIFIEPKADKRIIHFRSVKFPARTLTEELPDSVNVKDFNLNDHMEILRSHSDKAEEFAL